MPHHVPNELHRDLLSVSGLNPWDGHDSSARKQMWSSHIGQALVVAGTTERRTQTGMEAEYGKYTFATKIPVDCVIVKVIELYPQTIDQTGIRHNPQTIVIYEDDNTREIGIITLKSYCSNHQYFGFAYQRQPALSEIRAGAQMKAGKVLLDSPNKTSDGGYKYGVELNMAFMSMPGVSEDGIVIARSALKKFAFKQYENRVVEFGNKRFPLNLYGDAEHYKPHPDIGDYIRADGVLMATRSYNEKLAPVEQNIYDLMELDPTFDKLYYANGAGGRVIDIRVHHDIDANNAPTPAGMEVQTERYDRARRRYYQEILDEYHRLKRLRPNTLQLTPEFHRLVVEAISVVGENKGGKRVSKLYRRAPLDDWRIEFVIEYDVIPTDGFKLSDTHGGKGVICQIVEDDNMPMDEAGNRAEAVMDPNSVISRMNLGRLYEQYINAASRDVAAKIRQLVGLQENSPHIEKKLEALTKSDPEKFQIAWQYLMGYYEICSPAMFVWFTSGSYGLPATTHLASVVRKGIYLYMPPDAQKESETIIRELERSYRPVYGTVEYVGNSGKRVRTRYPVLIGGLYMILLEKTADDWTAVSSGKWQHFGVLSQVTNADKYSQPSRQQAIRALGESEVRIYVSYAGPLITADILDRSNSPETHRHILYSIYNAQHPTNIHSVVDRAVLPLGGSKPLQLVKHIGQCAGWKFVHEAPRLHFNPQQVARVGMPPPSPVFDPHAVKPVSVERARPLRPVQDRVTDARVRPQAARASAVQGKVHDHIPLEREE